MTRLEQLGEWLLSCHGRELLATFDAIIEEEATLNNPKGWIGFDLDGTLAIDTGKYSITMIGPAQPGMLNLLRQLLDAGHDVRIFTARVSGVEQLDGSPGFDPIEARNAIHAYLKGYGLPALKCTAVKDQHCWFIIEDRAVAVGRNTTNLGDHNGYLIEACPELAAVVAQAIGSGGEV